MMDGKKKKIERKNKEKMDEPSTSTEDTMLAHEEDTDKPSQATINDDGHTVCTDILENTLNYDELGCPDDMSHEEFVRLMTSLGIETYQFYDFDKPPFRDVTRSYETDYINVECNEEEDDDDDDEINSALIKEFGFREKELPAEEISSLPGTSDGKETKMVKKKQKIKKLKEKENKLNNRAAVGKAKKKIYSEQENFTEQKKERLESENAPSGNKEFTEEIAKSQKTEDTTARKEQCPDDMSFQEMLRLMTKATNSTSELYCKVKLAKQLKVDEIRRYKSHLMSIEEEEEEENDEENSFIATLKEFADLEKKSPDEEISSLPEASTSDDKQSIKAKIKQKSEKPKEKGNNLKKRTIVGKEKKKISSERQDVRDQKEENLESEDGPLEMTSTIQEKDEISRKVNKLQKKKSQTNKK